MYITTNDWFLNTINKITRMLHLIQNLSDKFVDFLSQDPVRPHIPRTERVGTNKDIFVTRDENDNVQAITCVSYQLTVPSSETELFEQCDVPQVAVFYTIWSYAPGAGRQLIFDVVKGVELQAFVTVSVAVNDPVGQLVVLYM